MKKIVISVSVLTIALGVLVYSALNNRDVGLWVLNNSIRLIHPTSSETAISYGSQPWQKLDIYPQKTNAPVVIFVHGGSWRHGRRDQYRFAADGFIRKGYTVVVPDYIKYPNEQARYPTFVEDIALATAWVKEHIEQHNGDPENIFLAGHSAGAHSVVMLATDGQFLNKVGLSERDIRAVAGIAGPYSFIPDWYVTKAVFGPPDRYPLMDALNYVDGVEPDMLLLHSQADAQVGQYNQDSLAASLRHMGVNVETKLYGQLSHIDMVTSLHPWLQKGVDVVGDIDAFFKRRLR